MRRVAAGSVANLAGALVTGICGLGLTVVVTRGLSQENAGVFFTATSIFILVSTLSQLGTGTGLVYFISRCGALDTRYLVRRYLTAALRPVLAASLLCAIAIFIAAPRLAELTTPGNLSATTTYLRILALFVPFAALENVWLSATRGMGTMRANAMVEQVARPIMQLVLVGGAVLAGSATVGWAWGLSYPPAAIAAWFWWRRMSSGWTSQGPLLDGLVRQFWSFTLPRTATSIIQVLMQRFDIVLVAALSGVRDAAIYAAATRLVVAGQIGTTAITRAAQPSLGHSLALGDRSATNHIYQTSTAWLMLVTWPIFLMFIEFQGTLLQIFGRGYSAGWVVMILISVSLLVATAFGMVDMVLAMAGRTTWNLGNASLALAVNVGLDLWLVPEHGILGAAIGWAVAIVAQNLLALSQVGFAMGLHPFGRVTLSAGALSSVCFLGAPFLVRLHFGETFRGLAVGGALGIVLYAIGLWKWRGILGLQAATLGRFPRPVS